jgi:H+/gluconate symporter-like permease
MVLAADAAHSDNNGVLILAALLGIATVVVLITWLKVHRFLALIFGSGVLGLVAGLGPTRTVDNFVAGHGSTVGSVGLLPLAQGLDRPDVALVVLAIGAGSLFFSHVNDAGFWLVKEYFGLSGGPTIKTWSVMETIISVVGLVCVLLLNLVL